MRTIAAYLQLHYFAFSKDEIDALEQIAKSGKTIVLFEELDSASDFFSKIKSKTNVELEAFAKQTSEDFYAESYGKDLKVLRNLSRNYDVEIYPIDAKANVLQSLEHVSQELAETFLNEQLSGLTDTAENSLAAVSLHLILFSRLNEFRNAHMLERIKSAIAASPESNVVVMCGTDHFLFIRDALKDSHVEFGIINSERLPAGSELELQKDVLEGIKRLVSAEQLDGCVSQAIETLYANKAAKHLGDCVRLIRHNILYGSESHLVLPKLVKLVAFMSGQSSILRNKNLEEREKASELVDLVKDILALKEPEAGFSLTIASSILMKTGLLLLDAEEGKDVRSKDVLNVLSSAFKAVEFKASVRKVELNLKSKV